MVTGDAVDPAISTCDYSTNCSAAFVHCDLPSIYPGGSSEIHDHRDYSIRFYERVDCRVDVDDPPIANISHVPVIPPKNLASNGYCVLYRDIQNLVATDEVDEILVDLNENLDSVESLVVCSAETSVDSDENLSADLVGNHLDPDVETAVAAVVEVVPDASSAYLALVDYHADQAFAQWEEESYAYPCRDETMALIHQHACRDPATSDRQEPCLSACCQSHRPTSPYQHFQQCHQTACVA